MEWTGESKADQIKALATQIQAWMDERGVRSPSDLAERIRRSHAKEPFAVAPMASRSTIERVLRKSETKTKKKLARADETILPILTVLAIDRATFQGSALASIEEYKHLIPPPQDPPSRKPNHSELPAGFQASLKPNREPLHYTNQEIEFCGRNEYRTQILEFLGCEERFRWCLITGAEGSGKSRLALHALTHRDWLAGPSKQRQALDGDGHWRIGFCRARALNVSALDAWRPAGKTLLVIDYAGEYDKAVHESLMLLKRRNDDGLLEKNVRVMLLERFAGQMPCESCFLPSWLVGIFGNRPIISSSPLWGPMCRFKGYNIDNTEDGRGAHLSLFIGPLRDDNGDEVLDIIRQSPTLRDAKPTTIQIAVDRARKSLGRDCPDLNTEDMPDDETLSHLVKHILSVPAPPSNQQPYWLPLHVLLTAEMLVDQAANRHTASPDRIPGQWQQVVTDRIIQRMSAWIRDLERRSHTHTTLIGYVRLLWLATLTGGIRTSDLADPALRPYVPTTDDSGWDLSIFDRVFAVRVDGDWIGPVEPDLLGEWLVKILFEHHARLPTQIPRQPDVYRALAAWAFKRYPKSLENFRQRAYRNLQDSRVWDMLAEVMGRYATPFGHLYDKREWQEMFLGGEVASASKAYHGLVLEAIRHCRGEIGTGPIVVDLMAGGNDRVAKLLKDDTDFRLLAIDRDLSRLLPLLDDPKVAGRLALHLTEINGRIGIQQALAESLGVRDRQCDVIIARKALHEVPWTAQAELLHEVSEALRPGGSLVLYLDGPEHMTDQGRHALTGLLNPVIESPLTESQEPPWQQTLLNHDFAQHGDDAAAIFLNTLCKVKDWNDRNTHELKHRYFSSLAEVSSELAYWGMQVVEHSSWPFELMAARFNETGINRILHLAYDQAISAADVERLLIRGDDRHDFFCRFAQAHLGHDQKACKRLARSGFYKEMGLRWEQYDLAALIDEIERVAKNDPTATTTIEGPLVHIFAHVIVAKHA